MVQKVSNSKHTQNQSLGMRGIRARLYVILESEQTFENV